MSIRTIITRLILLFLCLATILPWIAVPVAAAQGTEEKSVSDALEESPAVKSAKPSPVARCDEVIALLQQQRSLLTRELAQIKRELAALKESMSEPGLTEIFAGIGYIIGFVGIAFFVHCRKSSKDS